MAQSPFQVVVLSLHGLTVVLSLRYVTTYLGMALAHLGSMHTPLSIPFIAPILLRVRRITLPLRLNEFCPLGIDFGVGFLGVDLALPCLTIALTDTRVLLIDRANCRDKVWGPSPNCMES